MDLTGRAANRDLRPPGAYTARYGGFRSVRPRLRHRALLGDINVVDAFELHASSRASRFIVSSTSFDATIRCSAHISRTGSTSHVLLAPAAALAIALGQHDGVWSGRTTASGLAAGQTGMQSQKAVLWTWPRTRRGNTDGNFDGTHGV